MHVAYDCRREYQPCDLAGDAHHLSGWEIGLRIGRGLIVKDECIGGASAKLGK
jgi:hypothetical protein